MKIIKVKKPIIQKKIYENHKNKKVFFKSIKQKFQIKMPKIKIKKFSSKKFQIKMPKIQKKNFKIQKKNYENHKN